MAKQTTHFGCGALEIIENISRVTPIGSGAIELRATIGVEVVKDAFPPMSDAFNNFRRSRDFAPSTDDSFVSRCTSKDNDLEQPEKKKRKVSAFHKHANKNAIPCGDGTSPKVQPRSNVSRTAKREKNSCDLDPADIIRGGRATRAARTRTPRISYKESDEDEFDEVSNSVAIVVSEEKSDNEKNPAIQGDPKMRRAVSAKMGNPVITRAQALRIGGYETDEVNLHNKKKLKKKVTKLSRKESTKSTKLSRKESSPSRSKNPAIPPEQVRANLRATDEHSNVIRPLRRRFPSVNPPKANTNGASNRASNSEPIMCKIASLDLGELEKLLLCVQAVIDGKDPESYLSTQKS